MTFKRFFYYGPFSFTTGAIIASGFGYNGFSIEPKTEKRVEKWDKVVGVYIWNVETGSSPNEMVKDWNHQVHLWLKFYVQNRLVPHGKRAGAKENLLTFLVSAFWHGFYPFYYVMFFGAALLTEVSKDIFKMRQIFAFLPIPARMVLANVFSMLGMNYLGILFNALTFENGLKFMSETYYLFYVFCFSFLIISRSFNLVGILTKNQRKLNEKKE